MRESGVGMIGTPISWIDKCGYIVCANRERYNALGQMIGRMYFRHKKGSSGVGCMYQWEKMYVNFGVRLCTNCVLRFLGWDYAINAGLGAVGVGV